MKGTCILTMGSTRQSREFATATQNDYSWQIFHVVEEKSPWEPKPFEELLKEVEETLLKMPEVPRAFINFGRSSVPYGIDLIARCYETLISLHPAFKECVNIGPSFKAATIFSDKWLIYQALTQVGLSLPLTQRIAPSDCENLMQQLRTGAFPLPAVLKVTDLTGGAGMEYIARPEDLQPAINKLKTLNREMIITQFVKGDELSFDVLRLGKECIIFPPGIKTATDEKLTHADHKIKVNGYIGGMFQLQKEVKAIVEAFDLQGFFSIEGVLVESHPPRWYILEGATRVTNNFQMQNASLGYDSFVGVSRYLQGLGWLPEIGKPYSLALSIPIYTHYSEQSLQELQIFPWVLQVKLENLAEMPLSRDKRVRLTVKMAAEQDLHKRLSIIEAATDDKSVTQRVFAELERLENVYGSFHSYSKQGAQNINA